MNNMRNKLALAILVTSALLVGCGKKSYVGTWESAIETGASSGAPKSLGQATIDGLAKDISNMLKATLELKDDSKFSLTMLMMSISGKYEVLDGAIRLMPEELNGQKIEELRKTYGQVNSVVINGVLTLRPSHDGTTLTIVTDSNSRGQIPELVFKRKAEAK